jgi:hypothetical protein
MKQVENKVSDSRIGGGSTEESYIDPKNNKNEPKKESKQIGSILGYPVSVKFE